MKTGSIQKRTVLGLLAALAVALSAVDAMLPPLPLPGVRLGLANVAVTAAAALVSPLGGVAVAALKVLFVLFTRGVTAAWMAGCGTVLAVMITVALLPLCRRDWMTFVGVSIAAAGAHTLGQLGAATMLLSTAVWSYAPWMLVLSIPAGAITGMVLNVLIGRLWPLINNETKGLGE